MGLLDALGSLTMAAGEELPGITQRVEGRAAKKVNAAIGADFEAARVADDVEEMKRVMSNAKAGTYDIGSTAPSADVFNVMSQGITGYQNDDYTKTVERLKATVAANPYDIESKVKLAKFTAEASGQTWTPAEETAATEDVTAQVDNQRRIDTAGVTQEEAGAKTAEATAEQAEAELDTLQGRNKAKNKYLEAYERGDMEAAARFAALSGDKDLADMIRGEGDFNKEIFDSESKMRAKFEKQTEDFVKIRNSYAGLLLLNEDPSPASDLATIFSFMKMLDPGSVVREGEFANAQNSGSAEQKLWANYNQLLKGYRLGEVIRNEKGEVVDRGAIRNDFMNTARNLYMAAREGRDRTVTVFRDLAGSYNKLDPDRVVMDSETDRVFAQLPENLLSEEGKKRAQAFKKGYKISTWTELASSSKGIGHEFGDEDSYTPPPDSNGQGGAGGDGASQAETLNPNRMQLSSGRWVVPDGKGGWKDE